jgi:autotransporter-associated beta strand protein
VSDLWSDASNWSSGGSPIVDGSATLVFPGGPEVARRTSFNDIDMANMTVTNIEFDAPGYDLTGNGFLFSASAGGIQANNTSGSNTIEVGEILVQDQLDINVASGGTLNVPSGAEAAIFQKDGEGTLILSGDNSFTAATLNEGTVIVGSNSALGNASMFFLQLNGGTIQSGAASGATITLANNFTVTGPVTVSGSQNLDFTGTGHILTGQTLTVNNTQGATASDGFVDFDGILFGPGSLTKKGTGTLALTGTNNYGGGTQLQGGTWMWPMIVPWAVAR